MKLMSKLTSLMSDTGNKWCRRGREPLISAKAAKKIQQSASERGSRCADDTSTPPYLTIIPQLNDKNEQIFKAAVLNLYKIAVEMKEYRSDILQALSHQAESRRAETESGRWLHEKIERLRQL